MIEELTRGYTQTRIYMDTPVVIELTAGEHNDDELRELTDRAFSWFAEVERRCSRFDEASELRGLCRTVGEPVRVSPVLFGALNLALHVARITDGALDPTIGRVMEQSGFNRNYLTGERVSSQCATAAATYNSVVLDEEAQTATLLRLASLDLGAVAKGLAIDLASRELSGLPGFVVNAGGDMFASGVNPDGEPWRIGIRHPRRYEELLTTLRVTDAAVCTSGDYERPKSEGEGHHIMNPVDGGSARRAMSVTVVAPTAIVADALSTAAFVLGPEAGVELLEREGADGLIVGADLEIASTAGMDRYR